MKDEQDPVLRLGRSDAEQMLRELVAALQRLETRLRLALRNPH